MQLDNLLCGLKILNGFQIKNEKLKQIRLLVKEGLMNSFNIEISYMLFRL